MSDAPEAEDKQNQLKQPFLEAGYTDFKHIPPDTSASSLIKETDSEEFTDRYDTKKLFAGIQRHLLVIALSIILWTFLGGWLSWYLMTHYRAEAVILYQENLPKTLPGGAFLNTLSLATALDFVTLPSNFQGVKAILGLSLSTKDLESMVEVPPQRENSNLIRIVCKSDNPNLAVDIANTLATISVKKSIEFNQKQLQAELDNYKTQFEEVNAKQAHQLKEIEAFKQAHQYFEMTPDYTTLLTQAAAARTMLQSATLRYNSLVIEYENLKRQVESLPAEIPGRFSMSAGGPADPLQARIMELQSSLTEAKAKYAPSNPKIKVLEQELQDIQSQLIKLQEGTAAPVQVMEPNPMKDRMMMDLFHMEGQVQAAQKTKQDLAQSLSAMEKATQNLPAEQIQFASLLENKKITDEQLYFLTKSIETIQLMLNIPKGSLELYQFADKARQLRDNWWVPLIPLLGLLSGLLFGLLWALLLEMQDKRLWTPKQVKIAYNVDTLCLIPELPHFSKRSSETKSLFFMRTLAERIEHLASGDQGPLTIAFISSTAKEGKSFVSYLLGHYYQRVGKKVIILEMDYRRNPFQESMPTHSLENYLRNPGDWHDLVIPGVPDRIKVGSAEPYMKELVKSKAMVQLLDSLKNTYDVIIFDGPGVLEDDYTNNVAILADKIVFIIGALISNKKAVDQSFQELDKFGVKPCGIVLNRVLPLYIEDEKIKAEMKRTNTALWKRILFWR